MSTHPLPHSRGRFGRRDSWAVQKEQCLDLFTCQQGSASVCKTEPLRGISPIQYPSTADVRPAMATSSAAARIADAAFGVDPAAGKGKDDEEEAQMDGQIASF